MTDLYCVLHKNPGYWREGSAAFLAGERGMALPEAAAAVRAAPGFLLENASLDSLAFTRPCGLRPSSSRTRTWKPASANCFQN